MNVYIGKGLLQSQELFDFCRAMKKRLVMITDSTVVGLYAQALQKAFAEHQMTVAIFSFPAGEKHKTRETKQKLENALLEQGYGRDTCVLALGGGVVSDLAGFLAATYCRGLPTIYLPSTLLAMVDASLGGKTGVNTPYGKNLIGSFHQPTAVFMDVSTLATLPPEEVRQGRVEMLKHALIADVEFYETLKTGTLENEALVAAIRRSCEIKQAIVAADEKETGQRSLLNFGHTIGHALETLSNYTLSHGDAVGMGILVETYLSILSGFAEPEILDELLAVFGAYGLPLRTSVFQEPEAIMAALVLDKKTQEGLPRFVLLDAIGQPHLAEGQYTFTVAQSLLREALEWARGRF